MPSEGFFIPGANFIDCEWKCWWYDNLVVKNTLILFPTLSRKAFVDSFKDEVSNHSCVVMNLLIIFLHLRVWRKQIVCVKTTKVSIRRQRKGWQRLVVMGRSTQLNDFFAVWWKAIRVSVMKVRSIDLQLKRLTTIWWEPMNTWFPWLVWWDFLLNLRKFSPLFTPFRRKLIPSCPVYENYFRTIGN